ncbi:hypothetical protein [Streptomyces sp. NPDC058603]|uniref:hypothetical protein n=1 Tax=unclassified Streptomyces TaxID=2593676 RepID=UPI00366195C5
MKTEHPRDVDPSITGQPHQVTGEVPDLMGNITRTLGNSVDVPAAVPMRRRRNPVQATFAEATVLFGDQAQAAPR